MSQSMDTVKCGALLGGSAPPEGFARYVAQLEDLLACCLDNEQPARERIELALDGEPGSELRRHYSLTDLRASGTFLTGSTLADRLAARTMPWTSDNAVFCDPACGAGDLLVAVARYLPLGEDLERTLVCWGGKLAGFEVQPLLVRAAKTRLALLAIRRGTKHGGKNGLDLSQLFPTFVSMMEQIRGSSPQGPSVFS